MRVRTAIAVAGLVLVPTTTASAGAAMPGSFDWSGFHLGGLATAGVMNSDTTDYWCYVACDAPAMTGFGGGGGISAGFNSVAAGGLLLGIEADISYVHFDNLWHNDFIATDGYETTTQARWNWLATLRARVGVAIDRALIYTSAGLAAVQADYRHDYAPTDEEGYDPLSTWQFGFAVGAGIEYLISENVSLMAEYLYVGMPELDGGRYNNDFTAPSYDDDSVVLYRTNANLFRLGVTVHL